MSESKSDVDLGFVLVSEPVLPQPEQVAAAGRALGMELSIDPQTDTDGKVQFYDDPDGRCLMLMLMDMPHPDAARMCYGVLSPDAEPAAAAPGHYIVNFTTADDSVRSRDARNARLLAAIVNASPCVGAMLGHGTVFHQPEVFQEIDADASAERLPLEVCIDVTFARESETMMSALTYGMPRYGREDILVRAGIDQPDAAYEFAMMIAAWLLGATDVQLPTGDTVGRDADEKVVVQRGPNPVDSDQTVMRFDLS